MHPELLSGARCLAVVVVEAESKGGRQSGWALNVLVYTAVSRCF